MFCPSCGKELPDGSSFCNHCGKPTSSAATAPAQKKGIPPLRLIGFALLVFVLVGYWSHRPTSTSSQMHIPLRTTIEQQLTNGATTVNATGYAWYKFTIPVRADSVAVNGHFTATGGTGNDIECYILDEDGFTNFKNGHPSNTYYNSGKVTQAKIGAANLPAGTYYVVLNNRFSLLTPKAVQVQATLTYLQ